VDSVTPHPTRRSQGGGPARPASVGVATAYLVHDLSDAAVIRRADLLAEYGAALTVAGFHRGGSAPTKVSSAPAVDLGRTQDGKLLARALSVLRHFVFPHRVREVTTGADVILARNLESLVLARRVRRQGQRLVYECLDIHRLLLGDGLASRVLCAVEAWALKGVDLIVVSSPRFRDDYFVARRGYAGEILLIENKTPDTETAPAQASAPVPQKPWVIGWFGMLRCRRSLEILSQLAAQSNGAIEVLIAGRPSEREFEDFSGQVASAPGLRFLGPYRAQDLPQLYAQVHFAWAIDYFEEGLNSAWLLPNRLYESLAHGAVPLALRQVETGAWLARHGVGQLLDDPQRDALARLEEMSPTDYQRLRAAVLALPRTDVLMPEAEARAAARRILGQSHG
jgi:succinoglycan biosynthesis protein ExoL